MKFIATILAIALVATGVDAIQLTEAPQKMAGGKKTSESEGNAEATINEADAKGKEMANAGKEQEAATDKKNANNAKVIAKADAAETKKSTVVRSDGLTYNNKGRFFRDGADKGKEVGGVNEWIATKKA